MASIVPAWAVIKKTLAASAGSMQVRGALNTSAF
jgi:hypothetical protein